jgi:hypothetical protein
MWERLPPGRRPTFARSRPEWRHWRRWSSGCGSSRQDSHTSSRSPLSHPPQAVVRLSRSAKVAQALLGEQFWGWLVTDRWSAYTWYPSWRRQLCWAHLLRDIETMVARGGRSQGIGEALQAQARQVFHWWQWVCDGTLIHASLRTYTQPIRWKVEQLQEADQTCGAPKTAGTCREFLKQRQVLWTFVRYEGVEPTNNIAEVRFVGQKPNRPPDSGDWPHVQSGNAARRENLIPVSVQCRPPLVKG